MKAATQLEVYINLFAHLVVVRSWCFFFGKDFGLSTEIFKVQLASDALVVIHALGAKSMCYSSLGLKIDDCLAIKSQCVGLNVVHICKSSNIVAHSLAHASCIHPCLYELGCSLSQGIIVFGLKNTYSLPFFLT